MAELSLNLPVVGEKDTTAEPKVTTALTEIQTQINGKIAAVNLEANAVETAKIKAEATTGEKLGTGTVRLVENAKAQSFLSWGQISEAGAVVSGSGDFTAAKTGVGEYEIKWTKAKSNTNYAVVITARFTQVSTSVALQETTKFQVLLVNSSSGAAISKEFSFIVVSAS